MCRINDLSSLIFTIQHERRPCNLVYYENASQTAFSFQSDILSPQIENGCLTLTGRSVTGGIIASIDIDLTDMKKAYFEYEPATNETILHLIGGKFEIALTY
jgi:hypothetical protein